MAQIRHPYCNKCKSKLIKDFSRTIYWCPKCEEPQQFNLERFVQGVLDG